jgi:hypothetical protein
MESPLDSQLRQLCEQAANEQDIELVAQILKRFEARHAPKPKQDCPQSFCGNMEV